MQKKNKIKKTVIRRNMFKYWYHHLTWTIWIVSTTNLGLAENMNWFGTDRGSRLCLKALYCLIVSAARGFVSVQPLSPAVALSIWCRAGGALGCQGHQQVLPTGPQFELPTAVQWQWEELSTLLLCWKLDLVLQLDLPAVMILCTERPYIQLHACGGVLDISYVCVTPLPMKVPSSFNH